jgi:NitT/TauT family transport system ATP-binding protein
VPQIAIQDVQISYPGRRDGEPFVAVDNIDLEVEQGEFVTIVGPSGCGKSTLLLSVDGLVQPSRGRILLEDRPVTGPAQDRAMVFQEFGLLPWRTVLGNVMFGMEIAREDRKESERRARELIRLVGLEGFERHHPHELSGGMRQRVGIARALAVQPQVLLMDEPFGALDAQTREIMAGELLKIWDLERKTVLFVTHGIDEAVYLADRVLVMSKGPGHVLADIPVDLPRPRTTEIRDSPEYLRIRSQVSNLLFGETADERRVRELAS